MTKIFYQIKFVTVFRVSIFIFFLIVSGILSSENFRIYKTEVLVVNSELPEEYSIQLTEYINGYAWLIFNYLDDVKKTNDKPNLTINVFQNCELAKSYINKKTLSDKFISPYNFKITNQKSWVEFELSGCFSSQAYTNKSIQHTIAEAYLNDNNYMLPDWFRFGFIDYFENSIFLADDESIVPIQNYSYTWFLLRNKQSLLRNTKLIDKIFTQNKVDWLKENQNYHTITWSLFSFLFDFHKEGREILTKTIEYSKNNSSNKEEEIYKKLFGFLETPSPFSLKELNNQFNEWIQLIQPFAGLEEYLVYKNKIYSKDKIESLLSAIELNKEYYYFYFLLAKEFYKNNDYENSYKYSLLSLNQKINHVASIEILFNSALQLESKEKIQSIIELSSFVKISAKLENSIKEYISQ